MPFKKGSQEARDHMAKIRLKKGDVRLRNINRKPKEEGKRSVLKRTKVEVPIMSQSSIAIPEFFAVQRKKGKYALVNPLTKARNLSSRGELNSIKLIRKPIDHMIIMSHQKEPIPLSAFSKKDRETIDEHFKVVAEHRGEDINDIPNAEPFENAERGRPERLPENIRINRERKLAKKEAKRAEKEAKVKKPRKEKEETKEENEVLQEEKEQEPEDRPARTRTPKHKTDKERTDAIKKSKREWARKHRADLKKAQGEGISAKDLKLLHSSSYKKDRDKKVGDWELDESISKPTASVYVNQKTKQPIVVHRGTEKTLSDWSNNLAYVMGKSKDTKRYKDSKEVQEEAEKKYGDTLTTGHSQGSVYSKLARNKKGIIDVNPASMGEVASEGTTIRSKTDPVSILAGLTNLFSSNKKNITTSGKSNPLTAHSINILDELGDTELGNGLRKKRGKGLLRDTKKVLGHLVSHISDMKEPVDKRDFEQAKMIIDDFKKIKENKISGNGIMPRRLEEMTERLMGCGVHHHHYHMGGMGVEGMLRDLGKYVQPTADASQDRAMRELKGSGVDWEKLARDLGKYVQPTADAAQDRAMRELKGSGFNDLLKMATMENLDKGVATIGKVNPLYPKVYDELKGIKGRGADWEKMLRDLGKYVQPTADASQDRAMRELRGGRLRKSKSESDSESDEEKPKRRGRMVKGSKEAMEWARKMRESRRK
jgi:hypothetical protein